MASIYDKASLVLIPSGTKTSKVYSQKPTNGDGDFTFSRSTAATRVNASGNIEKETQNLLSYSNTFSNSYWTKNGSTITGGQTGYDGSSDAWLLQSSIVGNARIEEFITSDVSTFSVYAKAGNVNWIWLSDGTANVWFDLQNGVKGTQSGGIDASIESVGNGWYRVSLVSASRTSVRVYPALLDTGNSVVGSNIYIQDAQLEQGLVARDYIETTTTAIYGGITDNVPRLDYTDSSCPALLLEPQRTNQVEQSEYGGSTYWSLLNSTITDNAAISPEGVQNAFELTDNSTDGYHWIYRGGLDAGNNHRISFFAKANTLTEVWANGGSGTKYAGFNLSNGTIFSQGVDSNATIEDYGNGWYRCSFTSDFSGLLIAASKNGDTTYIGTGQSLYLYGIQSESAASYATSYIPTYGSAVTRNVDRNLLSTIPVDTSNNYTIFMDLVRISDNEHTTKWFDLRGNGGTYIQAYMISGGGRFRIFFKGDADASAQSITDENNPQKDEQYKFAIVRTDSSLKLFANGSLILTRTNKIPDELDYYAEWNANRINNHMLFPTALTDQEAIDLTTI